MRNEIQSKLILKISKLVFYKHSLKSEPETRDPETRDPETLRRGTLRLGTVVTWDHDT